jgi:hypothetical protein
MFRICDSHLRYFCRTHLQILVPHTDYCMSCVADEPPATYTTDGCDLCDSPHRTKADAFLAQS